MHMQNVISKRVKTSYGESTHGRDTVERTYETKHDEIVFKAQISQVYLSKSRQFA